MKKLIISIIILYFLTLFQTSFLVHLSLFGMIPNIVLVFVVLWNIFEKGDSTIGIYDAIIGGFFLDIFSNRFIGFNILILLLIAFILKLISNKYVRIPFKKI